MFEKIAHLSQRQLVLVIFVLVLPALVALLALGGEPWAWVDRPLWVGHFHGNPEFEPDLGRGILASLGIAAFVWGLTLFRLLRQGVDRRRAAAGASLVAGAVVLLAPVSQFFWMADGVDASRVNSRTEASQVAIDYLMMTPSEWSQAVPFFLMSFYACFAFAAVFTFVSVHAKENHRRAQPHRRHPDVWTAH